MTAEPVPDWLLPPPGGFTADDLDRLTQLPPHTELIDGSLVFVSPQADFHAMTLYVLEDGLQRKVPGHLRVRREMTVIIGPRQRPEPDLLVIRAGADPGPRRTVYRAADVVLVVEVVSPESEERDRKRKPLLYAEAGIPNFWRVENDSLRPIVYTHELEPATHTYVPTGIYHDRLKTSVPFDIDIDLARVQRLV
jgi:Uma2 family endonuclease